MNKSLALTLGALLLTSTAALAQEEKVLNVYNWSDYIADDTIAKFEAATGIHVNYDVYDSNELLEAKLLAGNSGYDVVVPSANFLERQIAAGIFATLDKSKLSNLMNMDPGGMANVALHDPDNAHSVPYMTFTVGIGYNVDKLKERLGDVPVNTWDIVFKPELAAKLQDCGIALLDSPSEIMASALKYLGLDPNSENLDDLKKAEALMLSIRPHVRYFHSSQYIDDLGNGEICLAVGYSGDVFIAQDAAAEGVSVDYAIPKEGALSSYDLLAVPADAPHPDNAHQFINFLMQPEIIAAVSNYVFYANLNKEATQFVDDEVKNNPNIYPPDDVKKNLFALKAHTPAYDRELTRTWTRVKTGQ
ncbi:MAG: polyamine ABC transporter substrate-binding protein [Devosia nanyangense]|uniref:Putrescine-binding periplasmic protein n=1 Tax=Devosia nanyangense TaxID=1228055 RepID=A0A933L551_9HYPH|nr:polyamine ABC transporter substrate-binding protein [Devosia nanyangense]